MLTVAILLFSRQAEAGCKIEERRDMDGSSMMSAYMFESDRGALGIISGSDGLTLHTPLWQVGESDAPLEAGGAIKFLLEDGTTFQLLLPEMVVPKASLWGTTAILTTWDTKLPITSEQLAMLAASKVEAMEIPTVGQATRVDSSKAPWSFLAKKTIKLAQCWVAKGTQ
ncbi:MAG: hypothetical protein H6734_28400 [Alphaproteobacteria bacterium]|nr:hypothetical protein [Alphaproteobacteria bacterium]